MYERILVPLDTSALAEGVLSYAALLAKGLNARLELLRVIDPVRQDSPDTERGLFLERVVDGIHARAREYLDHAAAPLLEEGLKVSCTVREGDPASAIIEEADKEPGTLLAMSTHGRSGVARWLLGSVTDKVLHGSGTPMFIVRPPSQNDPAPQKTLETMIVPLDGSSTGEEILPHVVAIAKALSLNVTLVKAIPTSEVFYDYGQYMSFRYEEFSTLLDEEALNYLSRLTQRLTEQQVASVQRKLVHGHVASAIVDVAQETPNALLAMTTHGRSGVGRWVLGSVTDRVVCHSGAPVLITRSREPDP